jgi:Zn-dependent M28 family amino/carboxypeptidase
MKIFALKPCRFTVLVVLLLCVVARSLDVQYQPVSRQIVETRLGKYVGNDQQREKTLKEMFAGAGCDGQSISEQPVKGSKLPNVICTLPGSSGRTIIVGAHFDHISEGDGVVDNWSGASLLPSLYEALKVAPRKHSFVFIGFAEEEKGEVGSYFYAQQMTKEQVSATDAMVNMDTLGLAHTEVWGSHSDKRLNAAIAYVAKQLNLPVTGVDVEQVGSTDSEQFAARKIPSITIHSLTQETWDAHILHTSKDKLSAMRLDDYYESYRLIAAYLAFLDQLTPEQLGRTKH